MGVCYHSGNPDIFDYDLHTALRSLISEVSNRHVLLMGDFNYPYNDWSSHQLNTGGSPKSQKFVEHLDDCFLMQQINCPTRLNATLDQVITSEPNFVHEVIVEPPLVKSDHNMISWKCNVDVSHKITNYTALNYG